MNQQELTTEPDDYHIFVQGNTLKARIREQCAKDCPDCRLFYDRTCRQKTSQERCGLFNKAMVPAVFMNATLEMLITTPNSPSFSRFIQWLQRWLLREPPPSQGMALTGPQGIGKSFAMAALCRCLTLHQGIPCRFLDFSQFLFELKKCYARNDDQYCLLDETRRADVLIIDDIGSSRNTEWSQEILATLIAQRYNAVQTTFLTTNLVLNTAAETSGKHLAQWMGRHSFSRLKQMCYWFSLDGPDRRTDSLPNNNSLLAS